MSLASERGRSFELKVAGILRHRLKINVRRDKQSGAGWNKADISDYGNALPLHMELKDQQTIKIQEWFRQAVSGSSFGKAPSVVFVVDEEILITLRLDDMVNFLAEIKDLQANIDDLRAPINNGQRFDPIRVEGGYNADTGIAKAITECREGHLGDSYGYCQQLTCKYSRGYRKPKDKKR